VQECPNALGEQAVQGRIHPPWTFHDRPLKTISGMDFATRPGRNGGTPPDCTPRLATSHRPRPEEPTTLQSPPPNRSFGPYEAGREFVTVQSLSHVDDC
jgi:hypothetical protein